MKYPPLPAGVPLTISREEIAALPIRRYSGPVHLLASPHELAEAMDDIRHETVLGFDTETRPAFHKGESYPPSLVQVATARAVYLLPLQRVDCGAALAEFLDAPGILKAGVAVTHDLRQLKQMFPLTPVGVMDLGVVAKRHGIQQTGLRNLAGMLLGFRVPKGSRTSNWATPRLSAAQIEYAATDAWTSRELCLRMRALGMLEQGLVDPYDAADQSRIESVNGMPPALGG